MKPDLDLHNCPTAQLSNECSTEFSLPSRDPSCSPTTHVARVLATQEANYSHQQELDMIPLMMEKDYSPKGWLGLILGTRMWYAVYSAVCPLHVLSSSLFSA